MDLNLVQLNKETPALGHETMEVFELIKIIRKLHVKT